MFVVQAYLGDSKVLGCIILVKHMHPIPIKIFHLDTKRFTCNAGEKQCLDLRYLQLGNASQIWLEVSVNEM